MRLCSAFAGYVVSSAFTGGGGVLSVIPKFEPGAVLKICLFYVVHLLGNRSCRGVDDVLY